MNRLHSIEALMAGDDISTLLLTQLHGDSFRGGGGNEIKCIQDFFWPYYSDAPSCATIFDFLDALTTFANEVAGETLDTLADLLHQALCGLVEEGELSAVPSGASAENLESWLPIIMGNGCIELYVAVERIANTIKRRDDWKFVAQGESCGVSLVVFATYPDGFHMCFAKSAKELASALPPNSLHLGGRGAMLLNELMQHHFILRPVEFARRIKDSLYVVRTNY